jgi:hypothetical protein
MEYNQYKKELSGVYSTLDLDPEVNPIVNNSRVNAKAQEMIFNNHSELFAVLGYESFNYKSIANRNTESFTENELRELVGQSTIDKRQLEALAEYIHIEKMASDVSKFQQLTRFDTNKIATISEAQKRIDDIKEFKSRETYVPQAWFGSEGIKNSPVGQFDNDQFLVDIFERYFSLRDNPALVKVSLDKEIMDHKPKGTSDVVLRTDFKNDFIWFLYQNSLFKKGTYGGYTFKPNLSDPNAPFTIDEENKTVSFGGALLGNDINNPELELKYVQSNFKNLDQYVRFKIEYQKLDGIPTEQLEKDYYFLDGAKKKYPTEYLKQKIALYNSRNHNSFFTGPTSVANMFKRFKQENPELVEKYALIRDMKFNNDKKSKKSNMYLPDISDVNLRKQYKENLANLRNDSRPEIAEFFGLFNHIAMMQTGLNRRSQYDLGKIIDAEHLHETIDNGIGIGRVINELNQIDNNIKAAELNNLNKENEPIVPDLQLLGQFKESFINMLENNYRMRVRGYNYQVNNLALGKTTATPETLLSFNNVSIKSSLVGLPKDTLALTAGLFFDEEGEYTPEEFAESIKDKKLAILNQKLVVPTDQNQSEFDKLLLDYFGINNSGDFPTLEYKSKSAKKGFLSIGGLGLKLMPVHSVKDEAMANASTMAIGQATIVNPNAKSSSQSYVDELTAKYPGKLAEKGTRFKSTDVVWVFGSGIFANRIKNVSIEEFQIALDNTFNSYHKPNIDKAIKAGVKIFNVGTANGMDQMAVNYLEEQGYVKVPVYAAIGKYYQMRKSTSSFEDLNYDINSPVVTASTLGAKDLVGKLFNDDRENKWFDSLTEKEKFEKGTAVAYDKIITELNRNIKYKIQFANELVSSKGQIAIGNSPLSAALEQALYKMKADIIKHRMGNAVKAPIVVQPLSFNMEVGSFVKYQGATYIVTQFNENGTVQIYNPLLEGASAKIPVSKASVEILSSKAKIVNYKDSNYIVTPKGTIISLTSNKAMQWPENDGNRVAILKLAKASSIQSFSKVEVENSYYTPEMLQANLDKIYVFGDNNQRQGKKGQASIRDEANAMGISTKLRPSADEDAFMTDTDFDANKSVINSDIAKIKRAGKTVVFPKDGLGTGLAALKTKAPRTYAYLKQRLLEEFGFDNDNGTLIQISTNANPLQTKVKKLALSFTETPSSPNQTKLVNGTKTTTIRKENQAGLAKGESGTQIVKNTGLVITLRGEMTIEEAGGKTAMLKSEGVATEADFMYDQSRNWVNGTGTMFVYDIERFEDKYKGDMPMKDFLSLPLDRQRVIIEQQLNC